MKSLFRLALVLAIFSLGAAYAQQPCQPAAPPPAGYYSSPYGRPIVLTPAPPSYYYRSYPVAPAEGDCTLEPNTFGNDQIHFIFTNFPARTRLFVVRNERNAEKLQEMPSFYTGKRQYDTEKLERGVHNYKFEIVYNDGTRDVTMRGTFPSTTGRVVEVDFRDFTRAMAPPPIPVDPPVKEMRPPPDSKRGPAVSEEREPTTTTTSRGSEREIAQAIELARDRLRKNDFEGAIEGLEKTLSIGEGNENYMRVLTLAYRCQIRMLKDNGLSSDRLERRLAAATK